MAANAGPASRSSSTRSNADAPGIKGNASDFESNIGDSQFMELRQIFINQFASSGGNPTHAMFYYLNQFCLSETGKCDERCDYVLDKEQIRSFKGTERVAADEVTKFTRFVTMLNNPKSTPDLIFKNVGFDSSFFIKVKNDVTSALKQDIANVSTTSKDGVLMASSGKGRPVTFDSLLTDVLGSDKLLKDSNLHDHLSYTHTVTAEARAIIKTINNTPTSQRIKKLVEDNGILTETLQTAVVFRALGDNGKLDRPNGGAGVYTIPIGTPLGKILVTIVSELPDDKKFMTTSGNNVLLGFGNVANLVSHVFTSIKDGKGKTVRVPIKSDQYEYVSLALAFRFESKLNSKVVSDARRVK
jgi:hypothetical protein